MRRFFSFWWLCVREAMRGGSDFANNWQWAFANPVWQSIGAGVGAALGATITTYWQGAPLMSPNAPIGVFLGGLFGFFVSWVVFFSFRFFFFPVFFFFF